MSKKKQPSCNNDLRIKKLPLTPEEHACGIKYLKKMNNSKASPKLKVVENAEGKKELYPDFKDGNEDYLPVWAEARARATGTIDENFGGLLLQQAVEAITQIDSSKENLINAVCSALAEIEPNGVLEGMLASQMVAAHVHAMAYFEKAINTNRLDVREKYLNLANKLLRTFSIQMETLKKHRTGGQQKVTVKHVHVHQGAQAIVGNVEREGGGKNKSRK